MSAADDLKKLAEAYPKLQDAINEHDADYGENCDCDDDCPLWVAAQLHASIRALNERIVQLEGLRAAFTKLGGTPSMWISTEGIRQILDSYADAAAQRKEKEPK